MVTVRSATSSISDGIPSCSIFRGAKGILDVSVQQVDEGYQKSVSSQDNAASMFSTLLEDLKKVIDSTHHCLWIIHLNQTIDPLLNDDWFYSLTVIKLI
ncbi:unnamed protein product, partial [Mesorhabditis belari]|uniref:Uncharacterized protein n=1 Tax=Mesorhabditis belari TaxID=2138241 RepID=A0AAF3F967_9BILA